VQGLLNIYETFHLANGHSVKLPPDKGEGQHWNVKPGNLFSKPVKLHIDSANPQTIPISLTEKIPAVEDDPKIVDSVVGWDGANDDHTIVDNKWVKHIRIQSERRTHFIWTARSISQKTSLKARRIPIITAVSTSVCASRTAIPENTSVPRASISTTGRRW
jgi:hypothetical protein